MLPRSLILIPVLAAVSSIAAAQPAGPPVPAYQAELAAPSAEGRIVVRDTIWRCSENQCSAGRSPRRHALVCAGLARSAGEVRRFVVNGQEWTADQLSRCNGTTR